MGTDVFVSLIPGWPTGEHGVAVTARGILVRDNLTATQFAEAISWGLTKIAILGATGDFEPCTLSLNRRAADVEPNGCGDLDGQECP